MPDMDAVAVNSSCKDSIAELQLTWEAFGFTYSLTFTFMADMVGSFDFPLFLSPRHSILLLLSHRVKRTGLLVKLY